MHIPYTRMPWPKREKARPQNQSCLLAKSSPGSARTARRDRIYLGNLFATPHTRSTLPHSVFCLRLSCPLVPNPAGKQAALKKIKMRKESDAGHLFLNFLLFNICQVGYFPAPFQNGPRDSII